ncbi:hypothetical protein CEXT_522261 [Caerostris extrusa]|uniref:Uncharacterized protein n=1 Tax=Caerostris extrusa TaxID=172846 RepID=A0AAV4M9C1_CAEEX|nr:hypothetical protein CEXT_522261 [Caerostris extrusa]
MYLGESFSLEECDRLNTQVNLLSFEKSHLQIEKKAMFIVQWGKDLDCCQRSATSDTFSRSSKNKPWSLSDLEISYVQIFYFGIRHLQRINVF